MESVNIYTPAKDINQVLNIFVNKLISTPLKNRIDVINNFVTKINNASENIINNLIRNLHKNNIVYNMHLSNVTRILDDYIVNKTYTLSDRECIEKYKNTETVSLYNTPKVNCVAIVSKADCNNIKGKSKTTHFIYDFERYRTFNDIIPQDMKFLYNADLIKILCIKPKALFEDDATELFSNLLKTRTCDKLIEDIMYIAFHVLYSTLNTDLTKYLKAKKRNHNMIGADSPYVHKLSKLGSHLTNGVSSSSNIYKYVKPITYGFFVTLDVIEDNGINDGVELNPMPYKASETDNKGGASSLKCCPINSLEISKANLMEFTLGVFCKNFDYRVDYKPDKYKKDIPKILLTGSMIGCYCLSSEKNKKAFVNSDIDVGVIESYLVYNVKKNIIKNIKEMNSSNINMYKAVIAKAVNGYMPSEKIANNTLIVDLILSYIVKDTSIKYDISYGSAMSKTVYVDMCTENMHEALLIKMRNKFTIDEKILNVIKTFIYVNYENVDNLKISLFNIYYYTPSYNYTKYRDVDIYLSSLAQVALYHETIVRSCYTNGEFLVFSDCLNSCITRTSNDYRLVVGKKSPIDVMIIKHKQCISSRILPNDITLLDFILGVALSSKVHIIKNDWVSIKRYITELKTGGIGRLGVTIGRRFVIHVSMCDK